MHVYSNRDVFVIGEVAPGGVYANAVWLKHKDIAGTQQELWDRLASSIHGLVKIPRTTAQIHTDIFLPYVTTLENRVQETNN